MPKIKINTAQKVVPMIYAYTTPEIQRHNGWTKIGYTEQGVDKRLNQQTHTADVLYHEEWRGTAIYDDKDLVGTSYISDPPQVDVTANQSIKKSFFLKVWWNHILNFFTGNK